MCTHFPPFPYRNLTLVLTCQALLGIGAGAFYICSYSHGHYYLTFVVLERYIVFFLLKSTYYVPEFDVTEFMKRSGIVPEKIWLNLWFIFQNNQRFSWWLYDVFDYGRNYSVLVFPRVRSRGLDYIIYNRYIYTFTCLAPTLRVNCRNQYVFTCRPTSYFVELFFLKAIDRS